jgi:HD-GYP domain-containing protein (c-di-GMP phosphodiesterase class II)
MADTSELVNSINQQTPDVELDDHHYAQHLAQVNEKNEVTAHEDILNQQGVLVVAAGTQIDAESVGKISKFKLQKKLDNSIAIENELDGDGLIAEFKKFIHQDPQFQSVFQESQANDLLRECCYYYQRFPKITQKITVLFQNIPHLFHAALLASWQIVMIAKSLALDPDEAKNIFIAALCRDLGFLHLPRLLSDSVLKAKAPDDTTVVFDEHQRHQFRAHPLISAKVLDAVNDLPNDIGIMVANHHEHIDGRGYPNGLASSKLNASTELLILADAMSEIYLTRLKPENRSLRDLIPMLQISSRSYCDEGFKALMALLKRADLPEDCHIDSFVSSFFVDEIKQKDALLVKQVAILEKTIVDLGFKHKILQLHLIQGMYFNLVININGAGIVDEAYIRWLDFVKEDPQPWSLREAEDVFLMVEEASLVVTNIMYKMERLSKHPKLEDAKKMQLKVALSLLQANIAAVDENNEIGDEIDIS